jgi:hypothetical protein
MAVVLEMGHSLSPLSVGERVGAHAQHGRVRGLTVHSEQRLDNDLINSQLSQSERNQNNGVSNESNQQINPHSANTHVPIGALARTLILFGMFLVLPNPVLISKPDDFEKSQPLRR